MLLKDLFAKHLTACHEIRGTQRGRYERLQREPDVGPLNALTYTPHNVIAFAERRRLIVQPSTIRDDIGDWLAAMDYAEVGLGLVGVSGESIRKAMPILKKHRLVGGSNARDRIPTPAEHAAILAHLCTTRCDPSHIEVIDYEYHGGRRVAEACRHKWGQLDTEAKDILIVDLKHPRKRTGHNLRAALTDEAFAIVMRQKRETNDPEERIFKANAKSVGATYRSACDALKIEGLQMKDSRAGVVTRLLKDGYTEQEVQLVTVNGGAMIRRHYNRMTAKDFPRRAQC